MSMIRSTIVLLATMLAATAPASAEPSIGTSAGVQGNVYVTTTGIQRAAQLQEAIRLQDTVLTKEDSALQILLLDSTTFTVGQNANLTITKFIYDPAQDSGEVAASVTKGAFRFMSGNIGKANPTNASVSTPAATIGLRGTIFEGVVGEDAIRLVRLAGIDVSNASPSGATLVILRGPGSDRNTIDRPGSVTVTSGGESKTVSTPSYALFVPGPGLPPIGPFKLTPDMQAYLDFFLRSTPTGPTTNPTGGSGAGADDSGQNDIETPVDGDDPFEDDVGDWVPDSNIIIEVEEFLPDPVMDDDHDDDDDDDDDEEEEEECEGEC